MTAHIAPLDFFGELFWLDGRPLLDTMEPYRRRIHTERLYTFDSWGRRKYTTGLDGRGKKNNKSTDLVLTALYFFHCVESVQGNDCILVANDEDQANDDLSLLKKLYGSNPVIDAEVDVQAKQIVRRDGRGILRIVPARDAAGLHGKTYVFLGIDEMHAYKNYDLLEALSPDPHRTDYFILIATYASIYNTAGYPLFDYFQRGKSGADPRMHFSWYSADVCTDEAMHGLSGELRANPSMASWADQGYLEQQRQRLPIHKYRRLHLNLPGMPDGAYFDPGKVDDVVVSGRRLLARQDRIDGFRLEYVGFVDMSGGSSDDAVLGIAHFDVEANCPVLDVLESQTQKPPFNPMLAVTKFVGLLQEYGITSVTGDQYAGNTFVSAFVDAGIDYQKCELTKHELYEEFEPLLNSRRVQLIDHPRLHEQLLGLVIRGNRIDHQNGEHDDWPNAAAGACVIASKRGAPVRPLHPSLIGQVATDYDPTDPDSLVRLRQQRAAAYAYNDRLHAASPAAVDYDPWRDRDERPKMNYTRRSRSGDF